jgi:hypothetical protein
MNEISTDHLWLSSSVSEDEEEEEASYYYCKLPQVPGSKVDGERERKCVCACACSFLFLMGFLPFCTQKLNKETNQFLVWNALIACNGEMKLGAGAVEVHTSIAFSSYVKFSWLVCWESLQPIEQKWVILLCCVGLQGEPKKKKNRQLLLASGLAQEVYQNFVDNTGLA